MLLFYFFRFFWWCFCFSFVFTSLLVVLAEGIEGRDLPAYCVSDSTTPGIASAAF
jgi:hypothetical protein